MGYEIHGVLETLLDVTIPDKFLAVYLKYYRNARLSEAEKGVWYLGWKIIFHIGRILGISCL